MTSRCSNTAAAPRPSSRTLSYTPTVASRASPSSTPKAARLISAGVADPLAKSKKPITISWLKCVSSPNTSFAGSRSFAFSKKPIATAGDVSPFGSTSSPPYTTTTSLLCDFRRRSIEPTTSYSYHFLPQVHGHHHALGIRQGSGGVASGCRRPDDL
jgi:hypothetical protein